MTDELRSLADLALKIIKADIEREGGGTPVIVFRTAAGELRQLNFPKQFAPLMNSGTAKDAIFAWVRDEVRKSGHTAVIFATECWCGKQTEAGKAIPTEEFMEYGRERGFVTGVAKGYIERAEAVVVTVQTPESVLTVTQFFKRDEKRRKITFGERQEYESPINQFAGRQKMYGDLREENLR